MSARRAIALPTALAALIVLAALASMANVAARASLREAAAVSDDARVTALRATLRARMEWQLARRPRAQLLLGPVALGERDTSLTVTALAWPWHRLDLRANGLAVVAEIARAETLTIPWCAPVVVGGAATIPLHALSAASGSGCADTSVVAGAAAIIAFDDTLAARMARPVETDLPDTVVVTSSSVEPRVVRARRTIQIGPAIAISGLVIAPDVRLASDAAVRGVVVARDALNLGARASVVADPAIANAAIVACARVRSLGRAGLLLPP